MALDRSKIQARLDALQPKAGKQNSFEKTDFSKIYWKPKMGTQYIRIVPSKFNKEWPFQQVSFHRDIVVKTMYSLTNWGEQDPIMEFIEEFKKEIYAKKNAGQDVNEDYSTLSKLRPKNRTYLQVVVRGEEHLGTRLWEFGNEVEEQILKIMNNADYGDITDIYDGVDLEVVGIKAEYAGNTYVKPGITARRNSSPLATDEDQLKKFLNDQHDPLKLFKKYTYNEIYTNLEKWLKPSQEEQSTPSVPENLDDLPFVPDPVTAVVAEVKQPLTKDKTSTSDSPKAAVSQATKGTKSKFTNVFNETK